MKIKSTLLALAAFSVLATISSQAAVLLQFDFTGSTAAAASNTQSSTFSTTNVSASTITRGAGIDANNAANSFRGTGFSNNGIALANTDFFQFTVSASGANPLTIQSITGNFNGTASFTASPGVTLGYGYSTDGGATFTLAPTFTQVGAGVATYTFTGADATALTNVNSATFKLFASGQTTTGGFGYQSAATAGTIGLQVDGIAPVPEPSSALLGALGFLALLRRRR